MSELHPPISPPSSPASGEAGPLPGWRVYRRRWAILLLFCLYSMTNAFQWIQYAIINNIVARYWNVSAATVDWLSMVYMVVYVPLIFPATWLIDKKGLRVPILLGSFGTMLAAWIKIGNAIGFLIPPAIVQDSQDLDEIGHDLSIMFYGQAAITSALFIIIIFVFQNEPKLPPSPGQAALKVAEPQSYGASILRLFKNYSFVLLVITYGINVGIFYGISTLLGQIVLAQFPGANEDAGRIGLVIVATGLVGSILCGIWLDKTHRFKITTVLVYILSVAGMLAFTFTLPLGHISVVYITSGLLGFFMTGYLPLGFEFAAEITYPEPEATTSGLLNASAQVFGIVLTITGGSLMSAYDEQACNLLYAATLVLGVILTAIIKEDLRRQRAHETHSDGVKLESTRMRETERN
ncbi:feline leukemia virus subgroup C receptor-related protein 1-like isoform X3 [Amphibalanus amphitrite]|uniref:feline leukemia virus subgroup C receptor-related protein 1-like isoform X3 n=1 Tax=Amphibalanus amphitrite TaxID=1232801 RepID=UPI001C8FF15C|nr:feline leukemia virus subgroup C receptor-related protein 1-like isoform X3 [Amphibalanus amphitrite]